MNYQKIKLITSIVVAICILIGVGITYKETGEIDKNEIDKAINVVVEGINTYNMSEQDIIELPTTDIPEQTIEDENATEQEVEDEAFELQGEIAYNGTEEYPSIALGEYKGLTYYSQLDTRWKNQFYTITGNTNQTIGSSGCGPTSASMIVTAIKGTITPDEMARLFVQYNFRSANSGTYWSAFRWISDVFNIEYKETSNFNTMLDLLRNDNYLVASVGNGLFTTGGHFIVLTGIEGNNIKVYDPYLYAGKFDTATRRGKASVVGNTIYVSIENFKQYSNYKGFFCYKHEPIVQENTVKPVVTATYTRYVKVNTRLNVRNAPNGQVIDKLTNGTQVTVYETNGTWARIGDNRWVSNTYLVEKKVAQIKNTVGQTKKLKACVLYKNSNLSGTKYTYKANTSVIVLQNLSASIDKVKVKATGRIAYININNYK